MIPDTTPNDRLQTTKKRGMAIAYYLFKMKEYVDALASTDHIIFEND